MIRGLLLLFLLPILTFGQNGEDVLRYSLFHANGSARSQGMASSMGASGGDASGGVVNPAGLAILGKSELSISPYYQFTDFASEHYGQQSETGNSSVRLGSLSLLIKLRDDENGWNNMVFGASISKMSDFNRNVQIEGINPQSSLLDFFFNQVLDNQGANVDGIDSLYPFGASLAWQTFLLDTFNNYFFTAIPDYGQMQRFESDERGRMDQTQFNFAVNYSHKFYFGAGLNFRSVQFTRSSDFIETVPAGDTSTFLSDYRFTEFLETTGSGVNLNVGLIYRPSPSLRFGLAYHSPTWLDLTDYWYSEMQSSFVTGQSYSAESGDASFNYQMTTPGKITASAAVVFGKRAFVNVDMDYIDYAQAKLRYDGGQSVFDIENASIKANHQRAYNFRVGGEYRLSSFALRGGFSNIGNPLQGTTGGWQQLYSFGFGNRTDYMNWDFSLSYIDRVEEEFHLYEPSLAPNQASRLNVNRIQISLGLGFRI